MNDYEERGPRIDGFADRLVEVYLHRAGSEDVGVIINELQESSEELEADLARLVVTLAYRVADALTVHDITDPKRALVPAKLERLAAQIQDATRRFTEQEEQHG